ncbi:MAG: PTS sugar transporter subunit IIA [Candidatus Omnitrophota bacterium]|nr:PTS sugar transporter subunit IIA [Candidatus Omnitrophota bacterium]
MGEKVGMELTINDIVKIFAVSEERVNNWIEKKNMPCIKANEQYRFNYIELLDWALQKKINLTPEILTLGDRENYSSDSLYQAIKNGHIYYDIPGDSREEVLKAIVDLLPLPPKLNRKSLWQMLVAREEMMSTSVGNGVAIPHVRNPVILQMEHPSITLCFLKKPVDFKAIDGKPVFILFTILSPSVKKHLAILSRLAFCLQNAKLKQYLHAKATQEQILAEIRILESTLSSVPDENGKEGR